MGFFPVSFCFCRWQKKKQTNLSTGMEASIKLNILLNTSAYLKYDFNPFLFFDFRKNPQIAARMLPYMYKQFVAKYDCMGNRFNKLWSLMLVNQILILCFPFSGATLPYNRNWSLYSCQSTAPKAELHVPYTCQRVWSKGLAQREQSSA